MGVAFDLNSSGSAASHLLLDAFLQKKKITKSLIKNNLATNRETACKQSYHSFK